MGPAGAVGDPPVERLDRQAAWSIPSHQRMKAPSQPVDFDGISDLDPLEPHSLKVGGRSRRIVHHRAFEEATRERDTVRLARDRALADRDAAIAAQSHAESERDAESAGREEAITLRNALARTNERLQSELNDVASTRGASMVMRRAAQEGASSRRSPAVVPAAIAGLALLTIIVALIVLRAA